MEPISKRRLAVLDPLAVVPCKKEKGRGVRRAKLKDAGV